MKMVYVLLIILSVLISVAIASSGNSYNWIRPATGTTVVGGSGNSSNCSVLGSCSDITYLNYNNNGNFTVLGGSKVYYMTSAPLKNTSSGFNYSDNFDAPGGNDNAYVLNDKTSVDIIAITPGNDKLISTANGTTNWGVVSVDVVGGAIRLTMYFKPDDFENCSDYESWLSALAGGAPVSCVYYDENAWNATGFEQDYSWNISSPMTLADGTFENPPRFYAVKGTAFNVDNSGGNVSAINSIITETGNVQIQDGGLFFGESSSCALPQCEYVVVQGFKSVRNIPGNAIGLLFGMQDSSTTDYNYQFWGINTGSSLYGNANYNSNVYGIQSAVRIDINNNTALALKLIDNRFTFAGGSHDGGSNISNVGTLIFYGTQDSIEGGSNRSKVTTMKVFSDDLNLGYNVTNFYGLYLKDHSGDVNGSINYGVYSIANSNYFSNNTGFGYLNPQYKIHVGNTSATNNISIMAEGEVHARKFVTYTAYPTDALKSKDDILGIKGTVDGKFDFSTVPNDMKVTTVDYVYDYEYINETVVYEDCRYVYRFSFVDNDYVPVEECKMVNYTTINPKIVSNTTRIREGVDMVLYMGKLTQTVQIQNIDIEELKLQIIELQARINKLENAK